MSITKSTNNRRLLLYFATAVLLLGTAALIASSTICTLAGVSLNITLNKILNIQPGMPVDQLFEFIGRPMRSVSGEAHYQNKDGEFVILNTGERVLFYSSKPKWAGCYPEVMIRVNSNSVVMVFVRKISWWGISEEPWYIVANTGTIQEEDGFREAFASRSN